MRKTTGFLLACLGLCLAGVSGASNAQTPTYSDVTEVNVVEIPVQVLLDGKPVRGLNADNFAVYQDKSRQAVTGFEVVDLYALPADQAQTVPTPARRHFLMLFDMAFSEPKAIVQARAAAKDLLTDLHPSDLVAVSTYIASRGSELVLGFTSDREQIEAAIDSLGLPELIDRNPRDPLRLVVEETRAEIGVNAMMDAEGMTGGRTNMKAVADQIFLEQMEQAMRASEQATVEVQKDKIEALTRSFTDLARLMRSVSGRKHVVYLSEGYDSSLLLGTTDEDSAQETEDARNAGEVWKIDSQKRFGSSAAANDVEAMLEEFRRADCTIQAVDIGGLRGASGSREALGYTRQGGKDSLFQLARDTGGELYENFNDLSAAMGKMLERTGVTYVLVIQPDTPLDGAYHQLKVELKGVPRGARVAHRPGYYAPKPFAQRSRFEKMLTTAGQVLAGEEGGQVRASVLAAAVPGSEGTADVPVIVEIDGPSLLHLHQGTDLPAEIYVYAMDDKGQVSDFIAQTLTLDLMKVEARLLQSGLKFYGHLELPPGSYRARVLVRNGRTGFHGLRVVPLEVPSFTGAGPVLLPPFFPEPKGEWLVTREAPRPGRREVPPPFWLGDQAFLPAARPILGDEETRFALLGYNLADEGDLQVRSQVLTADGREVKAGDLSPVALVSRAPGEGGADRLELTFRPPALQPGEYLLRVTVTDAAGKAGTATTAFVVAAAAPGERS
ncbi:MAG TPA: VWA domain-containing protein [Thermoanaerobaculia bacterium]|nr:VWA domain-containing protein [Thermoanaerobaculia bacterium]